MKQPIAKIGFWSALLAFAADVGYGIVQFLQVAGAVRYPLDATLIYGFSLGIAPPFLLAMLALHYAVPAEKKFWTHAALLFSVMYATYVVLMYVVQLATVIPQSLRDPADTLLTVKPHSLFWYLDALGYISMGLATLFGFPAFSRIGFEKWLRRFFLANALMTPIIATVYFYPVFSIGLLLAGTPWLITSAGAMLCLAIYFRHVSSEECSGRSRTAP